MKDNTIIGVVVAVFISVAAFGSHFMVPGVEQLDTSGVVSSGPSSVADLLSWVVNGFGLYIKIMLFQVPGLPGWASGLTIFVTILFFWVLLKFARGNASA